MEGGRLESVKRGSGYGLSVIPFGETLTVCPLCFLSIFLLFYVICDVRYLPKTLFGPTGTFLYLACIPLGVFGAVPDYEQHGRVFLRAGILLLCSDDAKAPS